MIGNFWVSPFLLVVFLVYTYIHLILFDQLPYEYLTPLQAAIGVVQKVMLLLFDFILFVISYDHNG